jgi:leader peptidase (prepilin peptidase)/N-methyltransferase
VLYFEIGFWTLLGLIIGSFVNVCLDRLPLQFADKTRRLSLLNTPDIPTFLKQQIQDQSLNLFKPACSFCFSCGFQLKWFEKIPVLSFILSKGRCRKCKSWGWPLFYNISFSLLLILGYCWSCNQVRKTLLSAGGVLVILVFCVNYF